MKKAFILMLLAAAFLGGYYLGQAPEAPNISAWAKGAYRQTQRTGGKKLTALTESCDRLAGGFDRPQQSVIEIAGKLYRVGPQLSGSDRSPP